MTQSFLTQALHDPAISEIAVRADGDQHRRLAVAVANGKTCGEVEADVDEGAAAAGILAAVYGTATRVAMLGASASDVTAALRPLIAQVFTGECHHHSAA